MLMRFLAALIHLALARQRPVLRRYWKLMWSSNQKDYIQCSSQVIDSAGDATIVNSLDNSDSMSSMNALSHSLSDIRAMQQADPDIENLLSWVTQSQRPSRRKLQVAIRKQEAFDLI